MCLRLIFIVHKTCLILETSRPLYAPTKRKNECNGAKKKTPTDCKVPHTNTHTKREATREKLLNENCRLFIIACIVMSLPMLLLWTASKHTESFRIVIFWRNVFPFVIWRISFRSHIIIKLFGVRKYGFVWIVRIIFENQGERMKRTHQTSKQNNVSKWFNEIFVR